MIQLGAIFAVVVLYWKKLWPFYFREIPPKKKAAIDKQPAVFREIMTFVEMFCNKERWILLV